MLRGLAQWSLVAVLVGFAAGARADVVMMPPSCPPGSMPTASHRGPRCYPTTCPSTEACERLSRTTIFECAPAGLCLSSFEPRDDAAGACATTADCGPGTRCEIADRCIAVGERETPREAPPVATTTTPSDPPAAARPATRGCTSGGASVLLVLAIAGSAGLLLARRASARRSEDARALLVARGRATHDELAALTPDVSTALAPIAERVRVEVDDGETVYVLDPEETARSHDA